MAPRITAKQAIEVLKIHQIRRENAAIYQQLQSLKNEVADLHDGTNNRYEQLDQTQIECHKSRALIIQHQNQLSNIHANINCLTQDQTSLYSSFTDIQDQQTKQLKVVDSQRVLFVDKIRLLETQTKNAEQRYGTVHKVLREELGSMKQTLARKVDNEKVELIQNRLDDVEKDISLIQEQHCSNESASRVLDSIEETTKAVMDGTSSPVSRGINVRNQDQSRVGSIEQNSTTDDPVSGIIPILDSDIRVRVSTVPDDLDLDEGAANMSYADYGMNMEMCNDTFVMLPYQTGENDHDVDHSLSLKQKPRDTLAKYLKYGFEVVERVPARSEGVVIQRFVQGLTDETLQKTFSEWLDATSWTKKELQNVACLHGVSGAELPVAEIPGLPSTQASPTMNLSSNVLVPATESFGWGTQPAGRKKTEHEISTPQPGPRRSQRLAAKSQVQTQTTGSLETESQAEAWNARVGGAAEKHKIKETSERFKAAQVYAQQSVITKGGGFHNRGGAMTSKKRKRVNDKLEVTEKAQGACETSSLSPRHGRPGAQVLDRACAKLIEARNEPPSDSETADTFQSPRTPTRRIFRSEPTDNQPQTPIAHRLNALHAHKPNPQTQGLDRFQQSKATNLKPSPYKPQPRLVSKQSKAVGCHSELISDSDVFLPRPKSMAKRGFHAAKGELSGPHQKKARLPLPPPPEIPILSTSTEGDRRFDRW